MHTLMTDAQFQSLALIITAAIAIIPATMAAVWSRSAKSNSMEANRNATEAKENSAGALHEVKANGGMSEPDPTLNDKINHLIEMSAAGDRRMDNLDAKFEDHLRHSKVMDSALAEVFFAVKPDLKRDELDEVFNN